MGIRLAAIYNIFDGEELLERSLSYIYKHVDVIIIIYQDISNFGEHYDPLPVITKAIKDKGHCFLQYYEPLIVDDNYIGTHNETNKRLKGLSIAKQYNCTHFLFLDCDEMYFDFKELKDEFIASEADGSVCSIETYIYDEKYRIAPKMNLHVPFIHKLYDCEIVSSYPFRVDQTRKTKADRVVELSKSMHHFTWIRNDIERKIRNSSCRGRNYEYIRQDLNYLKEHNHINFRSRYYGGRYIINTTES